MHIFQSSLRVGALLAVGLAAAVSSAHAQVETYTGQNSFLNSVASGAYEEGFNSFASQIVASPQAFSFGGFSYTLGVSGGAGRNIYYSDGGGTEGSVFPTTGGLSTSFVITFTSGNVTAVGGTFFDVDSNFGELASISVTATLATGQSIVLASTNDYNTEPFGGFTSDLPITSLTLTSPRSNSSRVVALLSLDNLYVGRSTYASAVVPEPATWALLTLGGGALAVLGLRRRAAGPL